VDIAVRNTGAVPNLPFGLSDVESIIENYLSKYAK
jgi:hypothetical protein